ncbi:4Fe-4S dicluster domain-containing protein [Candidatus Woesearchaeota archaeon]|nr:4Fe-4S dicluster domain-containing protein [Candidatus Woesearchaeota archaeon]
MQVFKLQKKGFNEFLEKVRSSYELIAPIKEDLVKFEKINNVKDIHLEKNSYFPVKEYFFRKEETLFQFDGKKFITPKLKTPTRAFFGLRRCDLAGIQHQDKVFMEDVNDPYYLEARKNSFLLGYHCPSAPSEYCFCGSMNLEEFFDIMFYDHETFFLAEIGSKKGEFLVKKFSKYFSKTNEIISEVEKTIPGTERLEKKDISKLYDHKDWKKGVDICLSCTACTALCPTCYCFSIHDEISIKNTKESERKRSWSSCQVPEFTKVAGDHVFRQEREERFKHRIYHQLDYFKEKYNVNMCTGCGRCIEGCPTRIDFVKIINEME